MGYVGKTISKKALARLRNSVAKEKEAVREINSKFDSLWGEIESMLTGFLSKKHSKVISHSYRDDNGKLKHFKYVQQASGNEDPNVGLLTVAKSIVKDLVVCSTFELTSTNPTILKMVEEGIEEGYITVVEDEE